MSVEVDKKFEEVLTLVRGPTLENRVAGLFLLTKAFSGDSLPPKARQRVLEALGDPLLAKLIASPNLRSIGAGVAAWVTSGRADETVPPGQLSASLAAAARALGRVAKVTSEPKPAQGSPAQGNPAQGTPAEGSGEVGLDWVADAACVLLHADLGVEAGGEVAEGLLAAVRKLGGAERCPAPLLALAARLSVGPSHGVLDQQPRLDLPKLLAEAFAMRDDGAKFDCLEALSVWLATNRDAGLEDIFGPGVPTGKVFIPALRRALSSKLGPRERASALIVAGMPVRALGIMWLSRDEPSFLRLLVGLARVEIAVELERSPAQRNTAVVLACFEVVESLLAALVCERPEVALDSSGALDFEAALHFQGLLSDIFQTLLAYVADAAAQGDPLGDAAVRLVCLWLVDETEAHREQVIDAIPALLGRAAAPGSPVVGLFLACLPSLAGASDTSAPLASRASALTALIAAPAAREWLAAQPSEIAHDVILAVQQLAAGDEKLFAILKELKNQIQSQKR